MQDSCQGLCMQIKQTDIKLTQIPNPFPNGGYI